MAQLNPMLERLQQKIEDYNKDVQRKIDDVANRQKMITIGVVVFNLVVLLLMQFQSFGKNECTVKYFYRQC